MGYRKSTLRKLPPAARELAKLANDVESVHIRLKNKIEGQAKLERDRRDLASIRCTNPTHASLVEAVIEVAAAGGFRCETGGRPCEKHRACRAMSQAWELAERLDPDSLFLSEGLHVRHERVVDVAEA